MTGMTGLIIIIIGMIAGLGIALWLFTTNVGYCKVDESMTGVIDTASLDELYDIKHVEMGNYPELPPDEILEHYVMHRKGY